MIKVINLCKHSLIQCRDLKSVPPNNKQRYYTFDGLVTSYDVQISIQKYERKGKDSGCSYDLMSCVLNDDSIE
jgi:hypothetical protein